MGLLKWVDNVRRRRECAALIERFFAIAKRNGLVAVDATQLTADLMRNAYSQLPLQDGPYRGALLAACVVGCAAGEPAVQGTKQGLLYGKALGAMVDMARRDVGRMTYAEVSMLDRLDAYSNEFRHGFSSAAEDADLSASDAPLADLMHAVSALPTKEERLAAFNEVMRRTRQASGNT